MGTDDGVTTAGDAGSDPSAASPLAGEVAVVTGSTRGLGREIASVLAMQGAAVAVVGRHRVRGASVVDSIRADGGQATFFEVDLAASAASDELIDRVTAHFGGLSVLVNNAYASDVIGEDAPVGQLSDSSWDAILLGGLTVAFRVTRAALRPMLAAGRGSIVNVSARASVVGTPGMAAHAAAKGGMNALTRSTAVDYGHLGVRCNAVLPGHVLHEERDSMMSEQRREALEAMQLTRLIEAADVAQSVGFLASRRAAVLTGVLLPVDGGSTAVRASAVGGPDPRVSD